MLATLAPCGQCCRQIGVMACWVVCLDGCRGMSKLSTISRSVLVNIIQSVVNVYYHLLLCVYLE